MARGRPPGGPDLVHGLAGSPEAKRRLKAVLQTISGARSVGEVCTELGISETAFYKLRAQTLQQAVAGLEPRRRGRPPREPAAEADRVVELEQANEELRRDLAAARIREEIALVMPHLIKKPPGEDFPEGRARRRRRKTEQSHRRR